MYRRTLIVAFRYIAFAISSLLILTSAEQSYGVDNNDELTLPSLSSIDKLCYLNNDEYVSFWTEERGTVFGRQCCDENFFCLLGDGSICGLLRDGDEYTEAICFDSDKTDNFARNSMPVFMLWLIGMVVLLGCSESGRNCRIYFSRVILWKLCPGLMKWLCCFRRHPNNVLIDRAILRERVRSQVRIEQATNALLIQQRVHGIDQRNQNLVPSSPEGRNGNSNSPDLLSDGDSLMLVLKTKIHSPDTDSNTVCSVCLENVSEGSKIGDIACGHVFHSHCLKEVSTFHCIYIIKFLIYFVC